VTDLRVRRRLSRRLRLLLVLALLAVLAACTSSGPAATPTTASLAVQALNVQLLAPGVQWVSATNGTTLRGGDRVQTDPSGRAEIDYADGSLTRLDSSTTFTLAKLQTQSHASQAQGDLGVGRSWNRVQKLTQSGSFEVQGGDATAAARGTTFDVRSAALCPGVQFAPANKGAGGRNAGLAAAPTYEYIFTSIVDSILVTSVKQQKVTLRPSQRVMERCDGTLGPVLTLTRDELLADPWIQTNLAADNGNGPSPPSLPSPGLVPASPGEPTSPLSSNSPSPSTGGTGPTQSATVPAFVSTPPGAAGSPTSSGLCHCLHRLR
jgi:hypothetical protein